MKRTLTFLFLLLPTLGFSQGFTFSLSGNPINTAGWVISGNSYVDQDQFILTDPMATQAGYVYYNTPQNLANCSQFTVSFDFRITNSSSPTADGISFWYITNPPTGFVNGGGLGLPSNPNGLVLLLDTYNNNGLPDDNPLIALRKYNGNTAQYVEGSTVGSLTPDLTYQSFITDGNWHTCTMTYSFGNLTVAFDGNAPIITTSTTLNITGYFGFSASTGALWAKHAIKNVVISGALNPDPPQVDTAFYCQFAQADQLEAEVPSGSVVNWYQNATGGAPLATAPTPSTDVPGTYVWYVSQVVDNCNLESTRAPVVVVVNPLPHYDRYDSICPKGGSYDFYGQVLTQPGNYETVRPSSDASVCDSVITLHLTLKPLPSVVLDPNHDASICQGDRFQFQVKNPTPGARYDWLRNRGWLAGGIGQDTFNVTIAGRYQVVGTLNGCSDTSGVVEVTINPNPVAHIIPHDPQPFCAGETLDLKADPIQNNYSYLWSPTDVLVGETDGRGAEQTGWFRDPATKMVLETTNEFGCRGRDSIWVRTYSCCDVFIPNAFTPNGDGINDYFQPQFSTGMKVNELLIFNRYGQMIYRGNSPTDRWDGTYRGKPADIGVYKFYLKYTCADGSVEERKGEINLVK